MCTVKAPQPHCPVSTLHGHAVLCAPSCHVICAGPMGMVLALKCQVVLKRHVFKVLPRWCPQITPIQHAPGPLNRRTPRTPPSDPSEEG